MGQKRSAWALGTHELGAFTAAVRRDNSYVNYMGDQLEPSGWYGLLANELSQMAGRSSTDPQAYSIRRTPAVAVDVRWGGQKRQARLRLHWAELGIGLPAAMVAELFDGPEAQDGTIAPEQVLGRVAVMQHEDTEESASRAYYDAKVVAFASAFDLYVCAAIEPEVALPVAA